MPRHSHLCTEQLNFISRGFILKPFLPRLIYHSHNFHNSVPVSGLIKYRMENGRRFWKVTCFFASLLLNCLMFLKVLKFP